MKGTGKARTSWPLPLTTLGASLRRERERGVRRCFLPKSYKDFALNTSCTVLRRIGTVPSGHHVPFWCHICHAPPLTPSIPFSTFIPLGIFGGTFCYINKTNHKTLIKSFYWLIIPKKPQIKSDNTSRKMKMKIKKNWRATSKGKSGAASLLYVCMYILIYWYQSIWMREVCTWILWFFKRGWSKAGCFLLWTQSMRSPSGLWSNNIQQQVLMNYYD